MSRVEEPHAGIVIEVRDYIRDQLPMGDWSASRLQLWQAGMGADTIEWLIGREPRRR